ncbi:MAG: BREX-1 system adenine-specific DNA-methyltransferase PglX, partial [Butyrivibrio sp.]|nr:BREX-1 system adenine-specific DNA-methyltransferase PglX [Butyrivibrio sp.]
MNKTAIKNFAVWARTKLRDDIKIRAGFLGINEDGIAIPLPASTPEIKYFEVGSAQPIALSGETLRRRERIVDKLQKKANETDYKTAYDLMIETYASDWFNRFVALRFMEVNERFADNMRVLSSSNPDRHDPDIVSQPFSSDLEFTDEERADITEWKAKNETDKLFRFLLIKRCNQLSKVLPGLFEAKGDESELMMRQSFIDKDGIIYRLVNDIDEEDWKDQVQIIGWLYQYYNSDPKSAVDKKVKKGGKVTKFEVPAKTQLFTPDWIVRYMVENSLGRIWIQGHTLGEWSEENEKAAADSFGWKYYLTDTKQESEVESELLKIRSEYSKLTPEDLSFIDPSMGSGHVLVYAFDVLMQIYESVGYTRRDASRAIIENNIYGLDIDDRAYQLAYFAIMMKACEYDGRFLERGVSPHVYSVQESNGINRNHLKYFGASLNDIEKNNANNQIVGLCDSLIDAKEYGSILNIENYDWELLRKYVNEVSVDGQMSLETIGIELTQKKLQRFVEIGEVMTKKYWVTCTNPPYMSSSNMDVKLFNYVKKNYNDGRNDLYTVFILKCMSLCRKDALFSMIVQLGWMSLTRSAQLRKTIYQESEIVNLLHLGAHVFEELSGEIVKSGAFIMRRGCKPSFKAVYCKLDEYNSNEERREALVEKKHLFVASIEETNEIEGAPLSYWLPRTMLPLFSNNTVDRRFTCRAGMQTGNNDMFLRLWFEPSSSKVDHFVRDTKWFSYNKGGSQRKWYGNTDYVVNWENEGHDIKTYKKKRLELGEIEKKNSECWNSEFYFKQGATWSSISSETPMFRYTSETSIFDIKGPTCFPNNGVTYDELLYMLGYLNSPIITTLLKVLSPTLDCNPGTVSRLPYNETVNEKAVEIVKECLAISKMDWDSFETSWDFIRHPLVPAMETHGKVSLNFENWNEECSRRFDTLKKNEEELNDIFIGLYGLQEVLDSKEKDSEVTVRKAELTRDIKSLVSYAVGCMFGRYSLDVDGLVYAGGNWDDSKYSSFQPDSDNVIPITDTRYMDDDIVDRFCEWLKVAYGEENLEENLSFIANALGTKGTDPRDIIRNYFLNDFFKDHCQTYSVAGSGKRPIYWLFDSGKQNGFKALVYMHRYNADTIGRIRVSYLHPLQEKYENEVRTIDTMIQSMTDQRQISAEEKRREKLIKQIA